MMKRGIYFALMAVACAIAILALVNPGRYVPPPRAEVAMITQHFRALQVQSFLHDVEYCGYIAETAEGRVAMTESVRGDRFGCTPELTDDLFAIASFHTHGAYDPDVPSEFPSTTDMEADASEGIDGYVATPGGRLWHIDGTSMKTRQVCGLGCLPQDPFFRAGDDGEIAQQYSYSDLVSLEDGD